MSEVVEPTASSPRRARRRRALITLAIVALMLFFAFWYAYSYYRASAEHPSATPHPSTCTRTAALTPAQVKVNVYNATSRPGLAAKTAAEVRKRGFRVATVANDPLQKHVTAPAVVRYGRSGTASSVLVIKLVKGAKAVPDHRTDSSVDLVLGDSFTALVPASKKPAAPPASTSATC